MKSISFFSLLASLSIGLAACLTGCDATSTDNSIGVDPDSSLVVDPGTADLLGQTSIVFTASVSTNRALFMPLRWSVDDPSLGVIQQSAGFNAVYRSTGKVGINVVMVRDQGESEGLAVVNQQRLVPPEEEPATETDTETDTETETEAAAAVAQPQIIIIPEAATASESDGT